MTRKENAERDNEDYSCEYPKHYCELKAKQESAETVCRKLFKPLTNLRLISQKNYRAYWYLRTTGAIQQELTRQKQSPHWYMIHPFSQIRLFWETIMILVVNFSMVFFPIRSGFLNPFVTRYYFETNRSVSNVYISLYICLTLDSIWLVDTFANFLTGYYDPTVSKVIMDPSTVMKNYGTRKFVLDLTSSLPIEPLLMFAFGLERLILISHSTFILLQLYNVYTTIRFFHYIRYCYNIGIVNHVSYLTSRITFAVIVYCWVINWTIYISVIIPQVVYGRKVFSDGTTKPLSWIQVANLFNMTLWDQYKTTLLKSVFANIGVNTWDNMYAVGDFIIAVMIKICDRIYFIYFIVWFLEAVTAANALRLKFILILEQLKTYMKKKEIPMFLKKRLNRFYYYRFQAHYFRDRAILARLSPSLRKEISMYTCQKLIHNTEVFQSLPRRVVAHLVQRMHREMYFPQDVIIRTNTYGECMYFICSGTVAVWTASDKEICRLEDGEFFGEIALIVEDSRRTATVTAVTITEVYRLEAYDYKKIIQLYPDVYSRLEKFAADRFKMLVSMEGK